MMPTHSSTLIRASLASVMLVMASAATAQDNEWARPTDLPAPPVVAAPSAVPPGLPNAPGVPPMASLPASPATTTYVAPVGYQGDPRAREAWLAECRRRTDDYYGSRRNNGGVIGALVGAVAGGVIGNRIDDGPDRAGGTIGGAVLGGVVGAVAGNAIGKASRRNQTQEYDYCSAYFDDYYRHYSQVGYMQAPGYQAPMVRRPAAQPCTEEVVEEYVPVRSRVIRRAAPVRRAIPSKRGRIAPDKRIRLD